VQAAQPTEVGLDAPTRELQLYLEFTGLSALHQGFFQDAKMTAALSAGLAECLEGPVVLAVNYDTPTRVGFLELQVDRRQMGCEPTEGEDGLMLSAWAPIGQSLASYRDAVAGRYDLRMGSFRTLLRISRQADTCIFEMTGQYPPDGSTWSPCVRFDAEASACVVERSVGVDTIPMTEEPVLRGLEACLGL
jgi:hypothetical protein